AKRAHRHVSNRPTPDTKPRRRSRRDAPFAGNAAARQATCWAGGLLGSNRRCASASGVAPPNMAAPTAFDQRMRVPSPDHSHAGGGDGTGRASGGGRGREGGWGPLTGCRATRRKDRRRSVTENKNLISPRHPPSPCCEAPGPNQPVNNVNFGAAAA